MPDCIQSFVLKLAQWIGKTLEVRWRLHAAWRSQSVGKTEKMNHSLEDSSQNMSGNSSNTGNGIAIALLHQGGPRSGLQLSPYEITYGRAFQTPVKGMFSPHLEYDNWIEDYVQRLNQILTPVPEFVSSGTRPTLRTPTPF